MPNRTEARPAKAAFTNATGRLPLLRLFSTPLKIHSPSLEEVKECRRLLAFSIPVRDSESICRCIHPSERGTSKYHGGHQLWRLRNGS